MQIYMDAAKKLAPAPPPVEPKEKALDRSLNAENPNLYYGNLHMKFYYFCQQSKDHFATTQGKDRKRVFFAVSFFKDKIFFCYQLHKTRVERYKTSQWIYNKFKDFLRKSQRESTAFMDNIRSKIKRDFQYQQEEV